MLANHRHGREKAAYLCWFLVLASRRGASLQALSVPKCSGMGVKSSSNINLRSPDIWLIQWIWKIHPEIVSHVFEHAL